MRQVTHDVEAGDALFVEEEDRVRLGLGEHRHQDVRTGGLRPAGADHVVDGALDDPGKPQGRLRAPITIVVVFVRRGSRSLSRVVDVGVLRGQGGDLLVEEALQLFAHAGDRAAAVFDDVGGLLVVEQGQQQVFQPGKLVFSAGRVLERLPDGPLQLGTQHDYSPS